MKKNVTSESDLKTRLGALIQKMSEIEVFSFISKGEKIQFHLEIEYHTIILLGLPFVILLDLKRLFEFLDFNSIVDVEKKNDPRNAGVDVGKKWAT